MVTRATLSALPNALVAHSLSWAPITVSTHSAMRRLPISTAPSTTIALKRVSCPVLVPFVDHLIAKSAVLTLSSAFLALAAVAIGAVFRSLVELAGFGEKVAARETGVCVGFALEVGGCGLMSVSGMV